MNSYSEKSAAQLSTCDPRLVNVFLNVLKIMDHTILEGHRGKELQNQYFDEGKTKLRWPDGKHNAEPSKAVDATPYPVDFTDLGRQCFFAGLVVGVASQMNIKIRWGGDWNGDGNVSRETFQDLPHFEVVET